MSYKSAHRVLVFGGRDYADASKVNQVLSYLESYLGPFVTIEGGARGADYLARAWAEERGAPFIEMPANWKFYDKRAGHERNRWMLECCAPTYGVEFPGGKGTADMHRLLANANVPIWEIV